MTTNLFLFLLVFFSSASIVLTEAIKEFFLNMKKKPAPNLIALINAIVLGIGGTIGEYIIRGISFTMPNVVAIFAMTISIWIGSMIGYDKIVQLVEQTLKNNK